jgi:hypothetical protein
MGMIMFMIMRGVGGAAFAIDPAGIAGSVMLFLPDGHAVLDLIDDVATRAKRLITMRSSHAHPDCHFLEAKVAKPVYT